jgi:hypothetical protein
MRSFDTIVADVKKLYNMEYELLVELLKKVELIKEGYDDLSKEFHDNYPKMNQDLQAAVIDSYEYFKCRNAIDRLLDHYDPPKATSCLNNDN